MSDALMPPYRIDWYNKRRIHTSIGDLPPAEYEAAYYAGREASAVA